MTSRSEPDFPTHPPKDLGAISLRLGFRGQALTLSWGGTAISLCADRHNHHALPVLCHDIMHMVEPGTSIAVAAH